MMRMALLGALLGTATAAAAQPRLVPASDVEVLYRVSGAAAEQIPGGAPDGVRLQWAAGAQRLRAQAVGRPVYAIADLPRHVADIVFPAQSSVLELPLRIGDPQTLLIGADVRFSRRGTARVLGMECVDWAVKSRKVDAVGCVTADGVVLRADGVFDGRRGGMQAVSLVRGPLPPAEFVPPDGFFRLPMGTR